MSQIIYIFVSLLCLTSLTHADEFDQRLRVQESRSTTYLLRNISRAGTLPGSVAASPSTSDPNYYFHWTRDAALVMDAVNALRVRSQFKSEREIFLRALKDFVNFSRKTQQVVTDAGLGEPRYNLNGTAEVSPWARPQNDGPALRAITLAKFANQLLDNGENEFVLEHLYSPALPPTTLVKVDLEYIAHRWRDPSYDVWEELRGDHFYNRMVQRRALIEGAALAERLGDPKAAGFYRVQAHQLELEIVKHFDSGKSFFLATLNRSGGVEYKTSNLDMVVILGVLHGATGDDFLSVIDDRVLATAHQLIQTFKQLYPINTMPFTGLAIGRYPEDQYDGANTGMQGNPWFITTQAMAELCYRASIDMKRRGRFTVSQLNLPFLKSLGLKDDLESALGRVLESKDDLFQQIQSGLARYGDEYMKRALHHVNQQNGSMSEQFNRATGKMQGAYDLTWSYASFLTAIIQRERALGSRIK
jgi:glucoamylase